MEKGRGPWGIVKSFPAGPKHELFPVENLGGQFPMKGQGIRISSATCKYRSVINPKKTPDLFYFPNKDGEMSSVKFYFRSTMRIPG